MVGSDELRFAGDTVILRYCGIIWTVVIFVVVEKYEALVKRENPVLLPSCPPQIHG
jgi:hypothetical protein